MTKGTCPVTGRSEVQVTQKGVNSGADAREAWLFRWSILLQRVYALQVKGLLLSRRLIPYLPREETIIAVLILAYFRSAF